jgi:hypothetical protein
MTTKSDHLRCPGLTVETCLRLTTTMGCWILYSTANWDMLAVHNALALVRCVLYLILAMATTSRLHSRACDFSAVSPRSSTGITEQGQYHIAVGLLLRWGTSASDSDSDGEEHHTPIATHSTLCAIIERWSPTPASYPADLNSDRRMFWIYVTGRMLPRCVSRSGRSILGLMIKRHCVQYVNELGTQ